MATYRFEEHFLLLMPRATHRIGAPAAPMIAGDIRRIYIRERQLDLLQTGHLHQRLRIRAPPDEQEQLHRHLQV